MLIGRQRELDAIREAFLSGESLVTLTGPGGIGKTRLARELANTSESGRFVDLSAVTSPGALIDEARASLGLPPGADFEVALAEQSSILVVLDDFDGLVPEAVPLLSRWLQRAPEALWLVTSRVRLGLGFERVVELGGLSLPATELDASDALGLFVRRAELAGAPLAPGELPFAAELVSELGGSP